MRTSLRLLGSLAVVLTFEWLQAGAQITPANILLISADDLGYGDLGVHGSRDIPTPNLDALAAGGIRFTDAYASAPLDSPARAGLITGRYQQRFGHEFNLNVNQRKFGLPGSERTLGDRLTEAGYETALLGKWFLGTEAPFHPLARGFSEFFGFLDAEHAYLGPADPIRGPLYDGRQAIESKNYLTDELADRAVAFITRPRTRSFFLWLSFNAPHTPLQATEKYLAKFAHIADAQRRQYAAVLSAMDDGVGRVLTALRASNAEANTLVMFIGTHGGPTMAGTTVNGASNAPLKGSKRQTFEGGIRVPFFLQWKTRLPEGRTDSRPVSHLDIVPTALAAAGVEVKPDWRLDGVNLLPYLTGAATGQPHEALYWRLGGTMAIRQGHWKLVKTAEGALGNVADPARLSDLGDAELYDLSIDIGETRNLASSRPDLVSQLATRWQQWNRDLAAPLWWPPSAAVATPAAPSNERRIVRTAGQLSPLPAPASDTDSWPSFRGPYASGSAGPQHLPDSWNPKTGENILWQTPIPGLAHSSPVVWGDRVYVTSAISSRGIASFKPGQYGDGTQAEDRSSHRWMVFAIDKHSGRIVWERVAAEGEPIERRHVKTTYASATPATDGRILVAFFGSQGLYAYNLDGTLRWKVDVGHLDVGAYDVPTLEWGSASSPVIWKDFVFLQCDTHTDSFLLALNASTGEVVWKADRDELPSWGTPTIAVTSGGPQLVTNGSKFIRAYDPYTGKELWRLGGSSQITAPTPIFSDGFIVVASGRAPERPIFVVRPSARGDVTLRSGTSSNDFVAWSRRGSGPYMPTPLAYGGRLYVISNAGVFDAYNLETGARIYQQRLPYLGIGFSASPVVADGKIYISNEDGEIVVVAAGDDFKHIATNSMGELLMATPAFSDGVMFVRAEHTLFAIGRKR